MFFKKKETDKKLQTAVFKVGGLHCTSCVMNIDGTLEDLDGVTESSTSYAKGETVVKYDAEKTDEAKLAEAIRGVGYEVQATTE
jgi:Cd2+/Zn2+-exporting ATPase